MSVASVDMRRPLGTASGMLSVVFWSITAPVIAMAPGIHPFLYIGIVHSIGFCLFVVTWTVRRENPLPDLKKAPRWFILAGLIGISVHELMWVAALQQAPPLEATLIIYTWPLLVVIFSALAMGKKLGVHHMAGGFLGMCGITALMVGRGLTLDHFTLLPGHFYAVVCSLTWSVFAALSARNNHLSTNLLSMIFLISGLINLGIWAVFLGHPQAPGHSLMIAATAAVFTTSAYMFWDFGMKQGNAQLIAVISFLTPVLAAFYLVILGKAILTGYLLSALFLVVSGIGVAKYGERIQYLFFTQPGH
jgi:drug/metabolite transporter (DMT)-like permease